MPERLGTRMHQTEIPVPHRLSFYNLEYAKSVAVDGQRRTMWAGDVAITHQTPSLEGVFPNAITHREAGMGREVTRDASSPSGIIPRRQGRLES